MADDPRDTLPRNCPAANNRAINDKYIQDAHTYTRLLCAFTGAWGTCPRRGQKFHEVGHNAHSRRLLIEAGAVQDEHPTFWVARVPQAPLNTAVRDVWMRVSPQGALTWLKEGGDDFTETEPRTVNLAYQPGAMKPAGETSATEELRIVHGPDQLQRLRMLASRLWGLPEEQFHTMVDRHGSDPRLDSVAIQHSGKQEGAYLSAPNATALERKLEERLYTQHVTTARIVERLRRILTDKHTKD